MLKLFRELFSSFHSSASGRKTRITFGFFLSIISVDEKKENSEKASTVSMCTEYFLTFLLLREREGESGMIKENIVYTGDTTHSILFSLKKTINLNSRCLVEGKRDKNKMMRLS